jgi:hypothetical protein
VNVIANVLLPAGAYEPSPVDSPSSVRTQGSSAGTQVPSQDSQAVSDLLESGLL